VTPTRHIGGFAFYPEALSFSFVTPYCLRFLVTLTLAPLLVGAGEIVSGPLLGYRAHREVFIRLETRHADSLALEDWLWENPEENPKPVGPDSFDVPFR
jgi:hypothetical protein